jgi:hypothetical protein
METFIKKATVIVITILAAEKTSAQQLETNQQNWSYANNFSNGAPANDSYYTVTSVTNGTNINTHYNNGWGYYTNNDWTNDVYGSNYNNFLHIKYFAKRILSDNARTILFARNTACLDPINTGIVVKAIRHQRFAKSLYRRGFFNEAIQHSNFAASLAADAIHYYQPGYYVPLFDINGQDELGLQDEYFDSPYYKNGNNFKKTDDKTKRQNDRGVVHTRNLPEDRSRNKIKSTTKNELENQLPKETIKDDQLLKLKESDLRIDEL